MCAATAGGVIVAGCGSPHPGHTPAPASVSAAGAAAVSAYTGMWVDFDRAATTANWSDPALADHAAGQALNTLRTALQADHRHGLVGRGQIITHARAARLTPPKEPDRVLVSDCPDQSQWRTQDQAGQLHTPDARRRRVIATVDRQGTAWRVTRLAIQGLGTC